MRELGQFSAQMQNTKQMLKDADPGLIQVFHNSDYDRVLSPGIWIIFFQMDL